MKTTNRKMIMRYEQWMHDLEILYANEIHSEFMRTKNAGKKEQTNSFKLMSAVYDKVFGIV